MTYDNGYTSYYWVDEEGQHHTADKNGQYKIEMWEILTDLEKHLAAGAILGYELDPSKGEEDA